MTELFITSGPLKIWTESFGNRKNPCILLIWGSGGQGIMWPDEFCNQLAQSNFFVIRYDHRDTGLSSTLNYDIAPYNLDDMAQDAIAILNAYQIQKAHIVGASMGGFIGQLLAINFPERVNSLVSIASSPNKSIRTDMSENSKNEEFLPPPTKELLDFFEHESNTQLTTKEDYINQEIKIWRACNAGGLDFDEQIIRDQQTKAFDRIDLKNVSSAENHMRAIECSPDRTGDLAKIIAPTLVIHGDKDPLLPLEHGIVTAKNISNSKFVIFENMGHIFPFARLNDLVNLIINHTSDYRK